MTFKLKNVLICILIILLILSNVYFLKKSQETGYEMLIGIPAINEEHVVSGADFSKSTPLKNKSQVDTAFFSLLNANTIQKPAIADNQPDAVIWISEPKEGITYLQINLWLDEDSIIFITENTSSHEYREIDNTYYAAELKKIIENQVDLYR